MTPQAFTQLALKHLTQMEAIHHFRDCCKKPARGEVNVTPALGTIPAGSPEGAEHFPALFLSCEDCGYARTYFVGSMGLMDAWDDIEW